MAPEYVKRIQILTQSKVTKVYSTQLFLCFQETFNHRLGGPVWSLRINNPLDFHSFLSEHNINLLHQHD